jgi:hypothetical protein
MQEEKNPRPTKDGEDRVVYHERTQSEHTGMAISYLVAK